MERTPVDKSPAKVLVVDDEEPFRRNLQMGLQDLGYDVAVATNGTDGLKCFKDWSPDIVLVDLGMPVFSGVDMVVELKEKSPFTPVVVISGSGTLQDAVDVIRHGAWDYLIKPVEELGSLDLIVRRNLERAQLLKDNDLHHTRLERMVAQRTQQLGESAEQLRSLGDHLPNGMIYQIVREVDGRMKFVYVSAGIERLHGLTADAVLNDASLFYNQVLPEDREMAARARDESFKTMEPLNLVVRFEGENKSVRWMQFSSAPRRLADGRVLWDGIEMDITQRKQAEEKQALLEAELRQVQKLEALGTLAGGIAHDFNNILAAIISFAELAKSENPDNAPLQENLDQVLIAGSRAVSLVRQILSFSRQQKQERRTFQLSALVKEVMKLMRSTLPSTIEIGVLVKPGLAEMTGDPVQIHQVIMNLCTNAAHAMRGRPGLLQVVLDSVTVKDDLDKPHVDLKAGDFLRLSVTDNGHGMDAETHKRIFEPFFTTKPTNEGTGLGLSVVHGIVKDHDGAITVKSKPGAGSTFTIYLPVAAAEARRKPLEFKGDLPRGNGERVFFVDDEQPICVVARKMLKTLGYEPTVFNNGQDVLAAIQRDPQSLDLLVSDLTMPVMTGKELARRVLEQCPAMPVVIASGYGENTEIEAILKLGVREFLLKPMDLRTMATTVHRALHPGAKEA